MYQQTSWLFLLHWWQPYTLPPFLYLHYLYYPRPLQHASMPFASSSVIFFFWAVSRQIASILAWEQCDLGALAIWSLFHCWVSIGEGGLTPRIIFGGISVLIVKLDLRTVVCLLWKMFLLCLASGTINCTAPSCGLSSSMQGWFSIMPCSIQPHNIPCPVDSCNLFLTNYSGLRNHVRVHHPLWCPAVHPTAILDSPPISHDGSELPEDPLIPPPSLPPPEDFAYGNLSLSSPDQWSSMWSARQLSTSTPPPPFTTWQLVTIWEPCILWAGWSPLSLWPDAR